MPSVPSRLFHGTTIPYFVKRLRQYGEYRRHPPGRVQLSDEFEIAIGHSLRICVQNNTGPSIVLVADSGRLGHRIDYVPGNESDSAWIVDSLGLGSFGVVAITGDFETDKKRLKALDDPGYASEMQAAIRGLLEPRNTCD